MPTAEENDAEVLYVFVAFVEDNVTMSSIRCFKNHIHVPYFVQNRRKYIH